MTPHTRIEHDKRLSRPADQHLSPQPAPGREPALA